MIQFFIELNVLGIINRREDDDLMSRLEATEVILCTDADEDIIIYYFKISHVLSPPLSDREAGNYTLVVIIVITVKATVLRNTVEVATTAIRTKPPWESSNP